MTDRTKSSQHNIRIPADLWAYVQAHARKGKTRTGDCSAVIREWIKERMQKGKV